MIVFFMFATGIAGLLDLYSAGALFYWPVFTGAVLFAYFFIIRRDNRIDPLTGIGNRYAVNEYIHHIKAQPLAVLMIDIDKFKEINDKLGHAEGDNALCDCAAIIASVTPPGGIAARWGGDEFIIAAKGMLDAGGITEALQQKIDEANQASTRPYHLQISCGSGVFRANKNGNLEQFIKAVDKRMYNTKHEHTENMRRSTDVREPRGEAYYG
jgi:diguanylate cyclase (GGDEF)-like protein